MPQKVELTRSDAGFFARSDLTWATHPGRKRISFRHLTVKSRLLLRHRRRFVTHERESAYRVGKSGRRC
jgi:hypothetical protein